MFEADLARRASTPRAARLLIASWFAHELSDEELETAVLLVSELVTNAVVHGQGAIRLKAGLDDDRLLVEVMDEGGGLERSIRERDFDKVEGWGFKIIDAAASRWGTHEGTTHVWFELERRGPRLGRGKKPGSNDAEGGSKSDR